MADITIADKIDNALPDEEKENELLEEDLGGGEDFESTGGEVPDVPTLEELMKSNQELQDLLKKKDEKISGIESGINALRKDRNVLRDQNSEIIKALSARREELNEKNPTKKELESLTVPIEFDEDDASISLDPIKEIIRQEISQAAQPLQSNFNQLSSKVNWITAKENETSELERLLSEKDSFKPAFTSMGKQVELIDKMVTGQLISSGVDIDNLNPNDGIKRAFEMVASPDFQKDFQKEFPGVDPELILEADFARRTKRFDATVKMRKALNSLSLKTDENSGADLKELSKIPQSVGSGSGAGSSSTDDLKTMINDMDQESFDNLPDSTYKKIRANMRSGKI